jgi:hypothetical protein
MIKEAADMLIEALPADQGLADGSSEHHLALQALIMGLHVEDSPQ